MEIKFKIQIKAKKQMIPSEDPANPNVKWNFSIMNVMLNSIALANPYDNRNNPEIVLKKSRRKRPTHEEFRKRCKQYHQLPLFK